VCVQFGTLEAGYQYQEEMVEGYDLRERARELEEYLRREGHYAEFHELAGSSDIVTRIVGRVIFTLLEDRDGHRLQDVALHKQIADLEVALDGALIRNWGTSQLLSYGRGRLRRHQSSLRPDVRD
jgi:predicted metal-dependent phosphoesterase TrpH